MRIGFDVGYLLYGMVQSQFIILRVGNERKPLQGNGLSPFTLGMPLRLALSFGTQLGIFRSEIDKEFNRIWYCTNTVWQD